MNLIWGLENPQTLKDNEWKLLSEPKDKLIENLILMINTLHDGFSQSIEIDMQWCAI